MRVWADWAQNNNDAIYGSYDDHEQYGVAGPGSSAL